MRERLSAGNARFLSTAPELPQRHAPRVAVLTCADARIDPVRLFDAAPGALFVVRNAGNLATPEAIEALSFAVRLGVEAIVVLGHTDCGAIKDALGDAPTLPKTAAALRPHLEGAATPEAAAIQHARATQSALEKALGGGPPVFAALLRTETGEVRWL